MHTAIQPLRPFLFCNKAQNHPNIIPTEGPPEIISSKGKCLLKYRPWLTDFFYIKISNTDSFPIFFTYTLAWSYFCLKGFSHKYLLLTDDVP